MRKWYICILVASLVVVLFLAYGVLKTPVVDYKVSMPFTNTNTNMTSINPLEWITSNSPPEVQDRNKSPQQVVPIETIMHTLFTHQNISDKEQESLQTWVLLKHLLNNSSVLPNAIDAIKEAGMAWNTLMASGNESSESRGKEKQCPYYLSNMNATVLDNDGFKLRVPCGLTQGSSITIIGIPSGLLGNFKIDLVGEPLPGEPDPPVILHYNVRILGDKITEDPVIVQNTWTVARDWGEEERCPSPDPEKIKKVDELDQCNKMVGKDYNRSATTTRHWSSSRANSTVIDGSMLRKYFPFKQGYLSVATLRVGTEGIQMTVDGKHITSFAFRETLEPWLINEVRISGDIKSVSVVASNLPTSEDADHIVDLEFLISPPLPSQNSLKLFIGVFSTANNFKRRMAVRRTWMQYPEVRSGEVAVRFFVGLHKNQVVNEELRNEAQTYNDIQLMPFVDYYSLITWKTVAICIFGTEVVSANFVMKTDDDAFVRVDEVLAALKRINVTRGLLYGLINSDSQPHRNPDSKWFISPEEWAKDKYPPWAHGPGYVVSNDIAKEVFKRHKNGQLKMFKLEDVAMGIWIDDMKKGGLEVRYEMDERINNEGCKDNYVVAHYQGPRELLCLWQKLQQEKRAFCCG